MHVGDGYEWGTDSNDLFVATFDSNINSPSYDHVTVIANEAEYGVTTISAVACRLG